ncbi:MAG: DNA mismatch endonuclease Vsr [Magnetospirillum gryphiswaldense]|uniref:Very short patch repair endonuclease n=2 Tax=Magnetospirillum sulfuroxidans TaxID=611300 RepID=A0ABS5IH31_9PROT|nr:DNA mismatch endonuclease Vsr [Magnetospirillum gryphiswaldense]MBR9973576.1 DNA mismatch endonuclease Vsr [Magnetospirillum sulfuroxidans]
MSAVRGKNTEPEMRVRRLLHAKGYRFRLHRSDLPGTPDIVLPRHRTVIFVHGCFWHRHTGCKRATTPKTRVAFWTEKFERNVARDRLKETALREMGWQVIVVWECETKATEILAAKLVAALTNSSYPSESGTSEVDHRGE